MFDWLKNRWRKKIESSGGMQSKKEVISRKEEVASRILRGNQERRHEDLPFHGIDRRTPYGV